MSEISFLSGLPFADGTFSTTPRVETAIYFKLQKDARPVTLFPVHDYTKVPENLILVLQDEFNYVVEEGLTYPHHETMDRETFIKYWFSAFVAILIDGDYTSLQDEELINLSKQEWNQLFLGNFYIKPNYIGRCSHVCNAGFIVNHLKRGLGLGKELGRKYLVWAPKLGYVYSVFNLVFESNPASIRIWDSLGFDRIGYVKNVAMLKGFDKLVGAVMFGKDLK